MSISEVDTELGPADAENVTSKASLMSVPYWNCCVEAHRVFLTYPTLLLELSRKMSLPVKVYRVAVAPTPEVVVLLVVVEVVVEDVLVVEKVDVEVDVETVSVVLVDKTIVVVTVVVVMAPMVVVLVTRISVVTVAGVSCKKIVVSASRVRVDKHSDAYRCLESKSRCARHRIASGGKGGGSYGIHNSHGCRTVHCAKVAGLRGRG